MTFKPSHVFMGGCCKTMMKVSNKDGSASFYCYEGWSNKQAFLTQSADGKFIFQGEQPKQWSLTALKKNVATL